jgi:hypothetical protein
MRARASAGPKARRGCLARQTVHWGRLASDRMADMPIKSGPAFRIGTSASQSALSKWIRSVSAATSRISRQDWLDAGIFCYRDCLIQHTPGQCVHGGIGASTAEGFCSILNRDNAEIFVMAFRPC